MPKRARSSPPSLPSSKPPLPPNLRFLLSLLSLDSLDSLDSLYALHPFPTLPSAFRRSRVPKRRACPHWDARGGLAPALPCPALPPSHPVTSPIYSAPSLARQLIDLQTRSDLETSRATASVAARLLAVASSTYVAIAASRDRLTIHIQSAPRGGHLHQQAARGLCCQSPRRR